MRRGVPIAIIAFLTLFVAGEIALRLWGMRRYPLFVADTRYEYMTAPSQDMHFGRVRFATNELGMRCAPVGPKRRKRVLVIGDSVINGGYQTTQDSLATEIAQQAIGDPVQVLNLSAPSWGPDNAAAFIAAHPVLEPDLIIAVFSSHDTFDRMTFEPVVGHHPSYPARKPMLAWSM